MKVNVRCRDENGNIVHLKEVEEKSGFEVLADVGIAAAIVALVYWFCTHFITIQILPSIFRSLLGV